jgi:osmotically-inducible protein OsmY
MHLSKRQIRFRKGRTTMTQTTLDRGQLLHRRVLTELQWEPAVPDRKIGETVDGSVVTLTGTVETYAQKLAAGEAAHRVAGVREVVNNIHVRIPFLKELADMEVAEIVRQTLAWDVRVPHRRVQAGVEKGRVTLTGTVESWMDRLSAERAIEYLPGVRGITNCLAVEPRIVEGDMRCVIETALDRQFPDETDRVQVQVQEGVVTLWGTIPDWSEKQAVLETAGRARGARLLEDRLRILSEL